MNGLSSIDYARLIQYVAQNFHRQMLNKTQVNKILFAVYGRYLAQTGKLLFIDDTPKAWPYGPVFPIVNKRVDIFEIVQFTQDKIDLFKQNRIAQEIVVNTVSEMHDKSAQFLTALSHRPDTPWDKTIHPNSGVAVAWNAEIPTDIIKDYYKSNKGLYL